MEDTMDKLMGEMEESKKEVIPSGGMDSTELKEFFEYVMGDATEPPEVMNKMMNNLIQKLSMGLGYNVASNIKRQASLAKFLAMCEDHLFASEDIKDMPREEVMKSYTQAEKTLTGLFEMQRKFIVQNKDVFKTDSTPQEKLVSKLMTLSPDKLDTVVKQIDAVLNDKVDEKTEEFGDEDFTE